MDLYIHFPIRLYGVMLNYLRTETTSPLPMYSAVAPYVHLTYVNSTIRPRQNNNNNNTYKFTFKTPRNSCVGGRGSLVNGERATNGERSGSLFSFFIVSFFRVSLSLYFYIIEINLLYIFLSYVRFIVHITEHV
jgi:hypothetical protein